MLQVQHVAVLLGVHVLIWNVPGQLLDEKLHPHDHTAPR
jgi:hypothetical protein